MSETVINEGNKTNAITWADIFREKIDTVLDKATTYDEFVEFMKNEGIKVRAGRAQHSYYFSFVQESSEGFHHYRSTNLGDGYSFDDIIKKLKENSKKVIEQEKPIEEKDTKPMINNGYRTRKMKL